MKIKLKQEIIEKIVVLENRDKIILNDFLTIMKLVVDLLKEDDDTYVVTPNEELSDTDLEYILNFFEEFLDKGEIVIAKC